MGTLVALALTFLACWTHGADALEKVDFKFQWVVENYPYCKQVKCEPLSSPVFNVGPTSWHLRLDSRLEDGDRYLALFLVRETNDNGPDSIEVEFEASISNHSLPSLLREAQKSANYSFRRGDGYGWPKLVNRRQFWSQAVDNVFTLSGPLIVNTTLKVSKSLLPARQGCVAITKIDVNAVIFTWTIERYSTLLPGEMKTIAVKSLVQDGPMLSLAIFRNEDRHPETKVQVQVTQRNKQVKCFACKVSLIDANQKHLMFYDKTFLGSELGEVPVFLTRDRLMKDKDMYLPNDELSLKFHCSVSTGVESERILAYEPGTIRSA